MTCESCNEREATVALTRIKGNHKQVVHLCPTCAQQDSSQAPGDQGDETPKASAPEVFTSKKKIVQVKNVEVIVGQLSPAEDRPEITCSGCGMTYEEFRQGGRLGCAACYEAFGSQLDRLLKRIHGATSHTGKAPVVSGPGPTAAEEMAQLRRDLDNAVAEEAYERAAQLRDRIARVREELDGDPVSPATAED